VLQYLTGTGEQPTYAQFVITTQNKTCYVTQSISISELETKTLTIPNGGCYGITDVDVQVVYSSGNVIYVNNCSDLTESGKIYYLNRDLSGAEVTANCINIKASNIVFDCQGRSIKNSVLENAVIYSQANYATIRNCDVQASSQYFSSSNNGKGKGISVVANNNVVENNKVTNTFLGIAIGGNSNLIQNNWVEGNAKGIHLGGQYNVVKNNLLKDNNKHQSWGLGVWNGYYNQFINNKVYGSSYSLVLYNAANARLKCEKYSNSLYIYGVPWYSGVTGTSNDNITAVNITYSSKYIGSGASFTELSGSCSAHCVWNGDVCVPTTCIDSDGGLNYYLKGTATLSNGTSATDYCPSFTVLAERYCSSEISTQSYTCPSGNCTNGACVNQTTCTPKTCSQLGKSCGT